MAEEGKVWSKALAEARKEGGTQFQAPKACINAGPSAENVESAIKTILGQIAIAQHAALVWKNASNAARTSIYKDSFGLDPTSKEGKKMIDAIKEILTAALSRIDTSVESKIGKLPSDRK